MKRTDSARNFSLTILAIVFLMLFTASSVLAASPPVNDYFSAATTPMKSESGDGTSYYGFSDLTDATLEAGELKNTDDSIDETHSVWFKWEASAARDVFAAACSHPDENPLIHPTLGVFTGAPDTLDNRLAGSTTNLIPGLEECVGSTLSFKSVAGQTYWFRIANNTASDLGIAALLLIVGPGPENVTADDAQRINGENTSVPVTMLDQADPSGGEQALWYEWTAPYTGQLHVDACQVAGTPSLTHYVTLYRSPTDNPANLVQVSSTNEAERCDGMPQLDGAVTEGETYWIKAHRTAGAEESAFHLSLSGRPTRSGPIDPSISGDLEYGAMLTVNPGGWTGYGVTEYNWQWLRCNSLGSECEEITGETGAAHQVVREDLGRSLRVRFTAENTHGTSDLTYTDSTAPIPDVNRPYNDDWADAHDLGSARSAGLHGTTLNATVEAAEPQVNAELPARANSVWYSWSIPAASGLPDGVSKISLCESTASSAVLAVYAPTTEPAAIDNMLVREGNVGTGCASGQATVTIDRATYAGTTLWIQVSTEGPGDAPLSFDLNIKSTPGSTAQPVLSGAPRSNAQQQVTAGSWVTNAGADPVTYQYQWERCTASLDACGPIVGATAATYMPGSDDVDRKLRVAVTATNSAGATSTLSTVSDVIERDTDGDGKLDVNDDCPYNAGTKTNGCPVEEISIDVPPAFTGTAQSGKSLILAPGSASNTPNVEAGFAQPTSSVSWQRCLDADDAGSCTALPALDGELTIDLTAADTDFQIVATVTWQNADTTKSARVVSGAVADLPDSDGDGVPDDDDLCPNDRGDTKPNGCPPIGVVITEQPSFSGLMRVGETITLNPGMAANDADAPGPPLANSPALKPAADWQRCEPGEPPANCVTVTPADPLHYELSEDDLDHVIVATVTWQNDDGEEADATAVSAPVLAIPDSDGDGVADDTDACPEQSGTKPNGCPLVGVVIDEQPSISGDPWNGELLHLDVGSASNEETDQTGIDQPTLPISVVWQRCDAGFPPVNCTDVTAGATDHVWYELSAADVGHVLMATVTWRNGDLQTKDAVTVSEVVTELPDGDSDGIADRDDACPTEAGTKPNGCPLVDVVITQQPSISGPVHPGGTLTFDVGSAANAPTDQTGISQPAVPKSVTWQRCDEGEPPVSCVDVTADATQHIFYELSATDVGHVLMATVTWQNGDAQEAEASDVTEVVTIVPDADGDGVPDDDDACPAEQGTKSNGCPPVPVVVTTQPSIIGTTQIGETLVFDIGAADNAPTDQTGITNPTPAAISWQRCDAGEPPTNCVDVSSNATSYVQYKLGAADVGHVLVATITWRNSDPQTGDMQTADATAVSSEVTEVPDADGDGVPDGLDACKHVPGTKTNGCPPVGIVVSAQPTLSGPARVGQMFSLGIGAAANEATVEPSFAAAWLADVTWQRCGDPNNAATCSVIPTAQNKIFYIPTDLDVGHSIVVTVTWRNSDGDSPARVVSATVQQLPGSGGGQQPSGGQPGAASPALLPKIGKSLGTLKVKKGKLTVKKLRLRCLAAATGRCTGTATLTGKAGKKKVTLKLKKISAAPGKSVTVTFKVSKKQLKLIRRAKKLKSGQIKLTWRAPGFKAGTLKTKLTVKA